ncbi:MAG: glutamate 5-kinase [Actinomycetales bacterium]
MSAGPPDPADTLTGPGTVVVKVGSSTLTAPGSHQHLDRIVDVLLARAEIGPGRRTVVVTSGAVAAGLGPLGLRRRPSDLAGLQAAASVGQPSVLAGWTESFARHGVPVGQVLFDLDDLVRRDHYVNARATMGRLLSLGAVPVVNENDAVATDELRYGDNDRLSAVVAHLVRARVLVLLTDVDALYDRPPSRPGARRIPWVADPHRVEAEIGAAGSAVGSGGMRTKVVAARLAAAAGVPTFVTAASAVARAFAGEDVGTWFGADPAPAPARALWLAHVAAPRGVLRLDAGAVAAVVEHGASLLPAGITDVEGVFAVGDVVELRDPQDRPVARGIVGYSAAELPPLLGRSTHDLREELGSMYAREIVHRDDLVVDPRQPAGGAPARRVQPAG